MSDQQEPVSSLFGWCSNRGRPDHYHTLCRYQYTNQFGVTHRCSCPNHNYEDKK